MLRAIFATRVIHNYRCGILRGPGVDATVSKYLELRSLADSKYNNQLTAAIRRAAEALVVRDDTDVRTSWYNNVRALCQAATIHCHPETLLRLLGSSEQDWRSIWKDNEFMNTAIERDTFVGAVYIGNIEKVREMLASSGDAQRGSIFGYPLQCACSGGHKDIAILLLEHGADVNHGESTLGNVTLELLRPFNFGTPLQWACLGGHEDIVRMLLEPKYDLSTSHSECNIAAIQAARGGNFNIVRLLEGKVAGKMRRGKLLLEATKYGQLDFVRTLLNDEASLVPNLESALKLSLHEAANRGYHQIVRLLLVQGAKADYGSLWFPFSVASRGGYERVVRLLLDQGTITNTWPHILVPAASNGQVHIVTFLLESRIDVSSEGYLDQLVHALKAALSAGHESVVREIVDHGVSLEEVFRESSPR